MWSITKADVNGDGIINEADSLAALDQINMIELSNAKDYSFSHQSASRIKADDGNTNYWWAGQFCKASVYEKWKLNNYPFDKQKLMLKFENTAYDTSQLIMLNEMDSLTFKKDINLMGWNIADGKIYSRTIQYNSDFGDPNGSGKSSYSRVAYAIDLERISPDSFFIKLCLGVFIAFMVALIVFGISPEHIDSRFGLGIGALFAVAANKYVVDSNIPQTATNCLVDKVHEITFFYILLILIATIVSLMLHERSKHPQRKTFDIAAGITLLLSYIGIIATLWVIAKQG